MNILTFNPEDWYSGKPNVGMEWEKYEYRLETTMIPIFDELDKRNVKATFFCMGWLAEYHPEIIREIVKRGHQLGCNSYQHALPNKQTREKFKYDLSKSKQLIENAAGVAVDAYRAPNFAITGIEKWYFDILTELDFKYDSSMYGSEPICVKTSKGKVVKEFPVQKMHGLTYSGGGYFRMFPYFLIKKWAKDTDYVMTYFHPKDFDKGQPKWKGLSRSAQFKNYIGLNNAYDKWLRLMNDFEFISITEANSKIDWQKTKVINF